MEHKQASKMTIYEKIADTLFHVALLVACLLTVALTGIGLVEIGKGVAVFIGVLPVPGSARSADSAALSLTLKGFEFLFLAPLAYVVLMSMRSYVGRVTAAGATAQERHKAHIRLVEVKMFVIGLMIAVIATDLIAHFLGAEQCSYEAAITRSVGILTLSGYLLCLSRESRSGG